MFEEDFIAKERKHHKHHPVYGAPSTIKSKETSLKGFNPYVTPGETEAQGCSWARGLTAIVPLQALEDFGVHVGSCLFPHFIAQLISDTNLPIQPLLVQVP